MARVPITFYLNILAGILVLFNHYASCETGDVALNKVTGAAGRFYAVFRDTAATLQHGCSSCLETMLCGPALDSALPQGAAEYLKVRYCHTPPQGSESVGGTSDERRPHEGYGGSDFASVYYKPPVRPLPWTSAKGILGPCQDHLSQAVYDRSSEAMRTIGLLLRTCASWWWFRAPLKVTGVLFAAYSALSALEYLFGASVAVRFTSQVYMVAVADFLQCIEWEARRLVSDIGVEMMERAYGAAKYARQYA